MFFANYSVKELSALASTLKIPGRSKMGKAELFQAASEVIDAAHTEALGENNMRGWEAIRLANISEAAWQRGERIPRKLKKALKKSGKY